MTTSAGPQPGFPQTRVKIPLLQSDHKTQPRKFVRKPIIETTVLLPKQQLP